MRVMRRCPVHMDLGHAVGIVLVAVLLRYEEREDPLVNGDSIRPGGGPRVSGPARHSGDSRAHAGPRQVTGHRP